MEHSQLGLSEFLLVIVYKKIPEQKETEINDGLLRGKSVIFNITWHNDKEEKRYTFFRKYSYIFGKNFVEHKEKNCTVLK